MERARVGFINVYTQLKGDDRGGQVATIGRHWHTNHNGHVRYNEREARRSGSSHGNRSVTLALSLSSLH